MPADSGSGDDSASWFTDSSLLSVTSQAEGVREPYGGLFYERALIPFIKAPLLRPNHLPKAPLSHTIILRIRFQQMNVGFLFSH